MVVWEGLGWDWLAVWSLVELTGPIRTSPFAIARVDNSPAYAKEIKEYWVWILENG
jgi:hypothetical protein